jgi:hypothetical protein
MSTVALQTPRRSARLSTKSSSASTKDTPSGKATPVTKRTRSTKYVNASEKKKKKDVQVLYVIF